MFSRTTKFESFGASAAVYASPHPKTLIFRLSRVACVSAMTGVRLTQTRSRMSAFSMAQASTTKGISACGTERRDSARHAIGPVGKVFRTDRAEPPRLGLSRIIPRDFQESSGLLAAERT